MWWKDIIVLLSLLGVIVCEVDLSLEPGDETVRSVEENGVGKLHANDLERNEDDVIYTTTIRNVSEVHLNKAAVFSGSNPLALEEAIKSFNFKSRVNIGVPEFDNLPNSAQLRTRGVNNEHLQTSDNTNYQAGFGAKGRVAGEENYYNKRSVSNEGDQENEETEGSGEVEDEDVGMYQEDCGLHQDVSGNVYIRRRVPCALGCLCWFGPARVSACCTGSNVTSVPPKGLPHNVTHLTFKSTGMRMLASEKGVAIPGMFGHSLYNISRFYNYRRLQYLSFHDNLELSKIEEGAFEFPHWQGELSHLKIIGSPLLSRIPLGALGNFNKLQTLQITQCGLTEPPNWWLFHPGGHITEIDLSQNHLSVLGPNTFELAPDVGLLILEHNEQLTKIEHHAFNNSRIRQIRLGHNDKLTEIEDKAFANSEILEILDLSHTAIRTLPTVGLQNLQNLTLEGVPSMKMFPSVLKFSYLKEARLSYAHHCCAFAHPEKQDQALWKDFSSRIAMECQTKTYVVTPPMTPAAAAGGGGDGWLQEPTLLHTVPRWLKMALLAERARAETPWYRYSNEHRVRKRGLGGGGAEVRTQQWKWQSGGGGHNDSHGSNPWDGHFIQESVGDAIQGFWHTSTLNPNETYTSIVRCGLGIVEGLKQVKCSPTPDPFNPCEDVMGFVWLRVTVWFVVICALLGNFVVLLVTVCSKYKLTVAKFLMCNLAFADLILGLYLLLLASFDLHSIGVYFTYAIPWQYDGGCQAAGFLAIFSTNLSVCTLTVITMERWYAISYAINLRKRLRMRQACSIMVCIWVVSLIMAALPLIGVSSYSKTSICLPMEASSALDKGFLWFLLLSNTAAFVVICACYVDMYRQVRGNSCAEGRNDANIAKRMAVLVFTDFLCLFPIAFFGATAAAGSPLITVTDSKILLVFFFPLNSCCNPFLYAIVTKQFHKDMFAVLSGCGLCEKKAARYRATFNSNTHTISHTRAVNNTVHAINNNFNHRPSDWSVLNTFVDHNSTSSKRSSLSSLKVGTGSTASSLRTTSSTATSMAAAAAAESSLKENGRSSEASLQSRESRKLSVVREASHVSAADDMLEVEIEVQLDKTLDLPPCPPPPPPPDPTSRQHAPFINKGVRSISQYCTIIPREGSSDYELQESSFCTKENATDSDLASGFTARYSDKGSDFTNTYILSDSGDSCSLDFEKTAEVKGGREKEKDEGEGGGSALKPLLDAEDGRDELSEDLVEDGE